MKRLTKLLRELLTRTAALIAAFGIFFHPASFYRLERSHSLPPEAKPQQQKQQEEEEDGEDETVTKERRGKKERIFIDEDESRDTDDPTREQDAPLVFDEQELES